jgi:hypothetical protein
MRLSPADHPSAHLNSKWGQKPHCTTSNKSLTFELILRTEPSARSKPGDLSPFPHLFIFFSSNCVSHLSHLRPARRRSRSGAHSRRPSPRRIGGLDPARWGFLRGGAPTIRRRRARSGGAGLPPLRELEHRRTPARENGGGPHQPRWGPPPDGGGPRSRGATKDPPSLSWIKWLSPALPLPPGGSQLPLGGLAKGRVCYRRTSCFAGRLFFSLALRMSICLCVWVLLLEIVLAYHYLIWPFVRL